MQRKIILMSSISIANNTSLRGIHTLKHTVSMIRHSHAGVTTKTDNPNAKNANNFHMYVTNSSLSTQVTNVS